MGALAWLAELVPGFAVGAVLALAAVVVFGNAGTDGSDPNSSNVGPTRDGARLSPRFGNHDELHTQGVQDGIDGFEARVRAGTQGFVEALPAKACFFGDLRHAAGFGHVAERGHEHVGVGVFGSRRQIFGNDRVVIEICRWVECFVGGFLLHCFALLSSRAMVFAF
ncbi:exported hypothetical protein [Candidatus Sulfotelmatobacter sp. SbA7]|nr:exported hypothetical protein [Candidatus Sulfotelmatobacter sp. SbA7]